MANAAARWRRAFNSQADFSHTKPNQAGAKFFIPTDFADCHRFSIHLISEGFIRL
jgi:hypothetical protein